MDLHAVNGTVPAEQLESLANRLHRQPPHPGRIIRERCLGDWMSVGDAARKLDLEPAALEVVLACKAGVSPGLAARLEAVGWSTADVWNGLQADYDRAQTRPRREHETPTTVRSGSPLQSAGRLTGTKSNVGIGHGGGAAE